MHSTALARARTGLLLAVCTALASTVLMVVTTTPADAASRWSGYSIRNTGKADSAWIGGWKIGRQKVYRMHPTRRQVKGRYAKPRLVKNLHGKHRPGPRATQRAAWILSNYGARNYDVQAAAVDAAVFHLLRGGAWRINKPRGSKRIRQAQYASYVRSYARQMIRESKRKAGPYVTKVQAGPVAAGSGVQVTFTIVTRKGKQGLANLPVKFTYADAGPIVAYTNKRGRAVANFTAQAGEQPVSARVSKVPEWRLVVRKAKRKGVTSVAVAGVHRTIKTSGTITGVTTQVVGIANQATVLTTGQPLAGTYSLAGAQGEQNVTTSTYGPFTQATGGCTSPAPFSATSTATGSGSWNLAVYAPTKSGYYRWGVVAEGNSTTDPAAACGAYVRVQKAAKVAQARPSGAPTSVKVGKPFRLNVLVSGFDRSESHTVVSRLYGPFAKKENVKCVSNRLAAGKTFTRNVNGNTTFTTPKTVIGAKKNTGWYVWQTTLSTGNLIRGNVSGCGVPYKVVQ